MDDNLPSDDMMTLRREAVAALRARHLTQRQIVESLRKLTPPIEASLATINRDLRYLRDGWKKKAAESIEDWIADELADLDELERVAWREKRYELVLKIKERKAKLLGMDKPVKIAPTDPSGANPYMNADASELLELARKIANAKHTDK